MRVVSASDIEHFSNLDGPNRDRVLQSGLPEAQVVSYDCIAAKRKPHNTPGILIIYGYVVLCNVYTGCHYFIQCVCIPLVP